MMRSLFSGVTGLRSHQTRMDVIGNNISNVNTVGFKKSSVTFQDLFSETISPASGPTTQIGGINAKQIGLGSAVGAISTIHTQGASQYTGQPLDFAISGDGYFIIRTPEGEVFSRAGNFNLDTEGNLVNQDGNFVMGYPVEWQTGTAAIPPDTAAVPGTYIPSTTYDGTTGSLQNIVIDADLFTSMSVDSTGAVVVQAKNDIPLGGLDGTNPTTVAITKGQKITIGYVALASFTNPQGLEKLGGNNYTNSANSGDPVVGRPSDAGFGQLSSSTLEMSNVDLSEEMVNMIITQRGFQANSRIITTSDSILEELVNLKR